MSLRLVPGAVLCEGFDGNLVTCVEEAAHAARFDIVDEELWVTCVAGQIAAAIVLSITPTLLLALYAQKYLVEGLSLGAVKG